MPLAEVTERLGRKTAAGADGSTGTQVALFAVIGVFSTVAYAVLYLLLREPAQPVLANATALVATAVGEHRRQPALHLRRPRPHAAPCATRCRAWRSSPSGSA